MTTFRNLKVNAFVLPTSYSLCGTIFEPAWFCCSEPKYSHQMLDSSLLILKSSKLCFDAKKVFRPLGQILTSFVLTKSVFFYGFNQFARKNQFSCFLTQSSHIFEKMLFRKIVQYCPKSFKKLTFTSKKCSARLVRFLHFLFWLKLCFLRLQPACKESSISLLHHTIFSHFGEHVVPCFIMHYLEE